MIKKDPRRVAFDVLREVTSKDAYTNLALAKRLASAGLEARDNGFVTELVSGTCRLMGTYDAIIEAASGRSLTTLQPAVVDLLRLGAHQALSMNMAPHAAVAATVDLARATVGQRVTGIINAVLRKVVAKDMVTWTNDLARDLDEAGALAVRGHHPVWIVNAYADVLPEDAVSGFSGLGGGLGDALGDDLAERDALWQALKTLPPRQRVALVLRYYLDYSEAQTAEAMGCAVGTVKSQSSAGLTRLRERLHVHDRDLIDLGVTR